MTTKRRGDLVACLRELDALHAQMDPDPALEARIAARLRAPAKKPWAAAPFTSLWNIRRPLTIAFAACAVFFLSIQDDAPPEPPRLAAPQPSAAPSEPAVAPARDRIDETNPAPANPIRSPNRLMDPEESAPPPPPVHGPGPFAPLEAVPDERSSEHGTLDFNPFSRPSPLGPAPRGRAAASRLDDSSFWSPVAGFSSQAGQPSLGPSSDFRSSIANVSKPPQPHGPNAPACLSAEALKRRAELDCEEDGLVLAEITYLVPCGDELFQEEKHQCSDPDDDACTEGTVGDGASCVDPGALKDLAHEVCLTMDEELADFTYDTADCGGWMTRLATYTCCPKNPEPPPPPPPSPVCQSKWLGDGVTCKDYASLEEDAFAACAADGLSLADISVAGSCPDGQGSKVSFSCCKF